MRLSRPTPEDEDELMKVIVRPGVYEWYHKVLHNRFLMMLKGTQPIHLTLRET